MFSAFSLLFIASAINLSNTFSARWTLRLPMLPALCAIEGGAISKLDKHVQFWGVEPFWWSKYCSIYIDARVDAVKVGEKMYVSAFFWLSQLFGIHFKICTGSTIKNGVHVGSAGYGNTIPRVCFRENRYIAFLLILLLSLFAATRKKPASSNSLITPYSTCCSCSASVLSTESKLHPCVPIRETQTWSSLQFLQHQ